MAQLLGPDLWPRYLLSHGPRHLLLRTEGFVIPDKFPIIPMEYEWAHVFLIVTMVFQLLSVLVFFARVYTRAYPTWRFTLDDYIISFAFALMTIMFALQWDSEKWALPSTMPQFITLKAFMHNAKTGAISLPFWAWSTGLVKISIACMLLRFQQVRGWRVVLYLTIVVNVLLIAILGIACLFQCIPFEAWWNYSLQNRKCWSLRAMLATTYLSGACNVSTDIVISLMPLTFLNKIRRPTSEKVAIGILMALGMIASGFSMCKVILTAVSRDHYISPTVLGLLSTLEVQTSLIAACIPTLRSSSKRLLSKMGVRWSTHRQSYRRYGSGSSESGAKAVRQSPLGMNDIDFGGGRPQRANGTISLDDDNDHYFEDPETGRIIYKPMGLRLDTSRTDMNSEWQIDASSRIVKEDGGWQAQSSIGIAQ